ncbi:fungal specific transcription factor domain-containing protein [Sarocladium implicatum]|nr:fungal specific transcription factor domain-containing protein [Sarocladium implicatum]
MSSAPSRPCDTCRVRKTRCVKADDQSVCVLCAFHGKSCTYARGPPARRPRAARRAAQANAATTPAATSATLGSPSQGSNAQQDAARFERRGSLGSFSPEMVAKTMNLNDAPQSQHQHQQQQATTSDGNAPSPDMTFSPEDMNDNPALSLLTGTLGLDLDTHPEYIGQSNYHEPALLDLYRHDMDAAAATAAAPGTTQGANPVVEGSGGRRSSMRSVRRLDDRTMFLICPDDETASEAQRIADCDAIEDSVRPLGKTLMDLYFRIVHPSFPVLHKGVFITKHAISHRMFSPPLLAAVYLLALDYQLYDSSMAGGVAKPAQPNGQAALESLASRTMADDLKRPKLSTLQAGLLLLQRHDSALQPSKWIFTAQLVAVAQELGIHLDCTSWSIPEWEKGLRRRLGWALYIQDRWGALTQGRPRLLHDDDWDLRPCAPSDFPETQADENPDVDGSVGVEVGREVFMRQAQLATILSDVIANFYTNAATKMGGILDQLGAINAVNLARPLVLRLRDWYTSLPVELAVDNIQFRRLSANASLHLSFAAVSISLDRALLRVLTPTSPPDLTFAVRSTAKSRVTSTIAFLKSLQPEHMGALWGGASAHQVVSVGSLAGLLWATTEDAEEMGWCAERMDELRWCLRVRGQGAAFMREALRLLDSDWGRLDFISSRGAAA